jgi:outer membrane protein OmpA-like peptidoglycan-associated protein
MKRQLRKLTFVALSCFTTITAFSQNYLGVASSNYAGVMGLDVQPASFVDGRFIVDINLASANVGAWQNAKYFKTDVMPKWWLKSFKKDTMWMQPDSTLYDRSIFDLYDYSKSGIKTRGVYLNYQVDILNFAFHINPKIAIGFAAKSRMITNVDDIDPKLAKLAQEGLDFASLWNLQLKDKLVTTNMMAWNEYGVNYGQVVLDQGQHFLKVGARVKLLQGVASAYVYTDELDYELLNKDTATSLKGNFKYGYSDNLDDDLKNFHAKDFFKSASKLGFGLDLGVVYEWRPKYKQFKYDMDGETDLWMRNENKYELRAGVSVLDIGGMKFTKGGRSRDFSVNTSTLDLRIFDKANSFASFDSIIDSLVTNDAGWNSNQGVGQSYYMNTPTALNIQLDYHIWKWFYINATGNINMISKKNPSRVKTPNQFAITPSFDYAWFGLYVPISVNNYSGWKAGIASRLGPITVGVVDFNSLFARGKVRGTEFYVGLRLPILYSKPDDKDGDKVSDKKDECVDIPGVWSFKGCPDTDGDGIKDTEDLCPEIPGLLEFQGCPDRDGDKIPDKDDACPDLAGLAAYRGCPDTDEDGIIDPNDSCPTVKGLPAFNGCPDRDGDGVQDSEDDCPDLPGPLANKGCPDTDNDGLFDNVDKCPTVYGSKENDGCPWPDTDGDGLYDKDDACPTIPGPIENRGCPKIAKEEQEILNTAFENLEFQSGKAIILATSFKSLDDLAALLIKKPEWKLQIAGHTDNKGDAKKNMTLSKNRAEAVKKYLASKGVDAARLKPEWYGQTKPIATNVTPEGRQKNRRVEMNVLFE